MSSLLPPLSGRDHRGRAAVSLDYLVLPSGLSCHRWTASATHPLHMQNNINEKSSYTDMQIL